MASSTVSFDDLQSGSFTPVTVNGPADTRVTQEPISVHGVTEDYTIYSYRPTSTKVSTWQMTLMDLTNAMKQNFHDFFYTRAIGTTNTFTYTHTDGVEYTSCRFLQDRLEWTRTSSKLWNVSIQMRVPSEVT